MDDPADSWSSAVTAAAQGRYAEADIALIALSGPDGAWASLAWSTRASHRRQVGAIDEAVAFDARARETAVDAHSVAEARIGLAADAVAAGDAERAREHHVAAAREASLDWRTRTRWHWVGAELALLVGDRDVARDHARAAADACQGHSARHEAKSALVLAAVTGAVEDLPEVASRIREAGWITLAWPLALIAADHAEALEPGWLARAWSSGREATYAIEGALPPDLEIAWRAHPGVRRLRASGAPPGGE